MVKTDGALIVTPGKSGALNNHSNNSKEVMTVTTIYMQTLLSLAHTSKDVNIILIYLYLYMFVYVFRRRWCVDATPEKRRTNNKSLVSLFSFPSPSFLVLPKVVVRFFIFFFVHV